MRYFTIPPPLRLAPYVRFFWVLEADLNSQPYIHRSMADGCAELIFHYKGRFDEIAADESLEQSFTSGIHGQSKKFRRFITNQNFGILGVYLYPFALPLLFSMPASEFSGQMPDIETLLGADGVVLEEKIMLAADNFKRINILTDFLETRIGGNSRIQPGVFAAIQQLIQSNGVITVEKLASDTCLSSRQFKRKFKEFSGFSPKSYSRIIRFQHALSYYGDQTKTLSDIAYCCGYYDQSHFIKDFKEFSGHHPYKYFKKNAEGSEWKN